jgi:hypothetical protein
MNANSQPIGSYRQTMGANSQTIDANIHTMYAHDQEAGFIN